VLALSERADGSGKLELLEGFTTNPAGAAIVNTARSNETPRFHT
jgi:hypothetical protein